MRLSIRIKQIVGVTAIVGLAVVALSALYTNRLANVVLRESLSRGEMLANTILHRAGGIVTGDVDPYLALREDQGLRSILESSIYGDNISFAAIVDTSGTVIVHNNRAQVGRTLAERADLEAVIDDTPLDKLRVIFAGDGQTLEVRETLKRGSEDFGSIRIGVSTLLMRSQLRDLLNDALFTGAAALAVAVFVAGVLSQLLLRPIHVLRSGLTRLGQGEFGVTLEALASAPAPAIGDPDRVLQVTSNLVENALRLTPRGGVVRITAAPATLAVEDTGPGLRREDLPRAFERFYLYSRYSSDRPVGTGLGLSIVKELTQGMGGSVAVETTTDKGTRFTVRLPGAVSQDFTDGSSAPNRELTHTADNTSQK